MLNFFPNDLIRSNIKANHYNYNSYPFTNLFVPNLRKLCLHANSSELKNGVDYENICSLKNLKSTRFYRFRDKIPLVI